MSSGISDAERSAEPVVGELKFQLAATRTALQKSEAEAGELRGRLTEMEKALRTYKATDQDLKTVAAPSFVGLRLLRLLRSQSRRFGFALPTFRKLRDRLNG